MEKTETHCTNCVYYTRHFVFCRNNILPANCGHCLYKNNRLKECSEVKPCSCKHFVLCDSEIKNKKRNESLKDIITQMRKRLDEIFLMLTAEA